MKRMQFSFGTRAGWVPALLLLLLPCSLFCQVVGHDEVVRMRSQVQYLEGIFGQDNPHVMEISSRAAFLLLPTTGYREEELDKLVLANRSDLLCLSLVEIYRRRKEAHDTSFTTDGHTYAILRAIRRIGDQRSLPYCLYVANGFKGPMPPRAGTEGTMLGAMMLYELDTCLRELSLPREKRGVPNLEYFPRLRGEEGRKRRTMEATGVPESSIAIAVQCLAKNPEIAKGWSAKGTEFMVPDLELPRLGE